MSPRSEELMAGARRHLTAAKALLAADIPENAAASAYYAMLYAARAALSERGRSAKTHRGTWSLFSEQFVSSGDIGKDMYDAAQEARELREAADYEVSGADQAQATHVIESAERFLAAIEARLG